MNHVNDKRKKRDALGDFNQRDGDEGRERRRERERQRAKTSGFVLGEDDGEDLETVDLD